MTSLSFVVLVARAFLGAGGASFSCSSSVSSALRFRDAVAFAVVAAFVAVFAVFALDFGEAFRAVAAFLGAESMLV